MLRGVIDLRFDDEDFRSGLETVLGAAYRGAADLGEVLATAARIADGDADSWLREWTATGGAAWSAAHAAEAAGRRVSAHAHFRRAASYYAAALAAVARSSEPDRQLDLWRRQRACWDRVVDLLPVPGERLALPYEGTTLPGYFFRAPGAAPGEREAARGGQQRQRRRDVADVGPRRRRGERARLSLDDVRRAGPAGGAGSSSGFRSAPTGRRC